MQEDKNQLEDNSALQSGWTARRGYNQYATIYTDRYHNRVNHVVFNGVKSLLINTVKQLLSANKKTLKILDYGCGDGRFYNVFKQFAKEIASRGFLLEITAVDPSDHMLVKFKNRLCFCEGFIEVSVSMAEDLDNLPKLLTVLYHPSLNIKVSLVQNKENGSLKEEASFLGEHHCGICMFGVLGHVKNRERRVSIMKMISDIVKYQVLYSLPNANRVMTDEQHYHNYFIDKKIPINGELLNKRDVFYTRGVNKDIFIFYHLFKAREILKDLAAAGLNPVNGIQISNLLDEVTITQHPWLAELDKVISKSLPKLLAPSIAKYFLLLVEKSHNLEHTDQLTNNLHIRARL